MTLGQRPGSAMILWPKSAILPVIILFAVISGGLKKRLRIFINTLYEDRDNRENEVYFGRCFKYNMFVCFWGKSIHDLLRHL